MIDSLITWSLRNRFIVLMIAGGIIAYGIYAVKNTPVDAIPDLSEHQVIIFTEWMGRNPQIIEGLQAGESVVISGAYLLHSEFVFKKGTNPMAAHKM